MQRQAGAARTLDHSTEPEGPVGIDENRFGSHLHEERGVADPDDAGAAVRNGGFIETPFPALACAKGMWDEDFMDEFEVSTAPSFARDQSDPVFMFRIIRFVAQTAGLGAQVVRQFREGTDFLRCGHEG